ncbi:hypothetical protein NQD34_003229 [Periophthalmus magnuspinnatus]|nr:hypothetical protein NQD34_003229 [Periophthalmus magnuspinnatus]
MDLQRNINIIVIAFVFFCEVYFSNAAFYSVLKGSDVTLHCLSAKLPLLLDWSTLTVEWTRADAQGKKQTVYIFVNGRALVNRDGADVDRAGLLNRDASLKLPNVTVGDEGHYTCRVITPVVDTLTATLEVLARPSVWIPKEAAIAQGEEKMIVCDIQGYYPKTLTVSWLLHNNSHTPPSRTSNLYRVCTEMEEPHADGTYSIRSVITVHSSVLKDGQVQLVCQVKHQTFHGLLNTSVTLSQAPSKHYDPVILIAGTSVICVLVLTAVVPVLIWFSKRKALRHVPPNISEISQNNITYADVENFLKCVISGVGLGEFQVQWFKLSRDSEDCEAVALLSWDDVTEGVSLESDGSHHTSVLSLRLSTSEDKSRYRCVVRCKSQTFTRETTVHVKVQPSFLQISSIPQIPKVQRLLVLCCRVENFYPAVIYLEWYRNDGEAVHPATHYGPFSDHSHLYSMWSKMQLTMATEDESAVYICRVYHSSFSPPGYKDALYHINTQGTPPNVMFINCEPLCPVLNTECTLNLCIKDFCPKRISVTWTVDGEPVDSSCVFNTPPSLNVNGLYAMYSFLKLHPTQTKRNQCYRCKVEHSAQSQPEERFFTLTYDQDTPPLY